MAQQWAENNSEIAFEIVCYLDLKKNQFYMQINFLRWVDFFRTMLVVRILIYQSLICFKEFVLKSGETEKPT